MHCNAPPAGVRCISTTGSVKWGAPHSLRYIGVGCGALFEERNEGMASHLYFLTGIVLCAFGFWMIGLLLIAVAFII